MTSNIEIRRWVDDWVEDTDGEFITLDIWQRYNIVTKLGKDTVRDRLRELVDNGTLEKRNKRYRRIEKDIEEIDIFQDSSFAYIEFPFPLHKYIRLSEGSVMVVAGASDSGKTAFCLNTAILNYPNWDVHFFNSESGRALLKERILAIAPEISNPLPFKLWDRMDNFADVIRPDALNIIDYLDVDSEVYMVGAEIKKILQKLDKGVAIIGLQKPPERDLGYGGQFSLKKAECYLSLDKNQLKIIKAKSRANPALNPLNKTWKFWLDNKGSTFKDIRSIDGEPEYQEEMDVPF